MATGDIVQIKYNSPGSYQYPKFGHSVLVTHTPRIEVGAKAVYITSRTSSNSYHHDIDLYDAYPPAPNTNDGSGGHLYRLIKLDWDNE